MPSHQTLTFSCNFKAKIQCEFDEQKSIRTQEIEHDEKVTLTPE